MKTIAALVAAIRNGKHPVVTFKDRINDAESYAEPGMRARAIMATEPDDHGALKITFNFEEFDTHNTPLESANYFDKKITPA